MDGISPKTHLSHYLILSKLGDARSGEASGLRLPRLQPGQLRVVPTKKSVLRCRNLKRTVVLVIALLIPLATFAQQSDADFKTFWGKFKTAVINSDKNAVASLSKFPIGMSYGIRSIKTKAELIRRYKELFSQQTHADKCFATKEPERDSTNSRKYSVACPDAAGNEVVIYEFERGAAGWKFVRLDNINE